jgi:hypothetical protein
VISPQKDHTANNSKMSSFELTAPFNASVAFLLPGQVLVETPPARR